MCHRAGIKQCHYDPIRTGAGPTAACQPYLAWATGPSRASAGGGGRGWGSVRVLCPTANHLYIIKLYIRTDRRTYRQIEGQWDWQTARLTDRQADWANAQLWLLCWLLQMETQAPGSHRLRAHSTSYHIVPCPFSCLHLPRPRLGLPHSVCIS